MEKLLDILKEFGMGLIVVIIIVGLIFSLKYMPYIILGVVGIFTTYAIGHFINLIRKEF